MLLLTDSLYKTIISTLFPCPFLKTFLALMVVVLL
jgi:hypothetical protein